MHLKQDTNFIGGEKLGSPIRKSKTTLRLCARPSGCGWDGGSGSASGKLPFLSALPAQACVNPDKLVSYLGCQR